MLVHGVLVDERLAGVVGEQVFGQFGNALLGVKARLQGLERGCGFVLPVGKY